MRKFEKLNRKGFTLIELLAVIVILALLMVIAIPTVLGSMNKARSNQLQNSADSVADWFAKQYELGAMGTFAGDPDPAFKDYLESACGEDSIYTCMNDLEDSPLVLTETVLTAAGISQSDINLDLSSSTVYYNTSVNRVCVTLVARDGGSFYNTSDSTQNTKSSAGC